MALRRLSLAFVVIVLPAQLLQAQLRRAASDAEELARNTYVNLLRGISLHPAQADSARSILVRASKAMLAFQGARATTASARQMDSIYVSRNLEVRRLLSNDADRVRFDVNVDALSWR